MPDPRLQSVSSLSRWLGSRVRDVPPATVVLASLTLVAVGLAAALWWAPEPAPSMPELRAETAVHAQEPQIRVRVVRRANSVSLSSDAPTITVQLGEQLAELASPVILSVTDRVLSVIPVDGLPLEPLQGSELVFPSQRFEVGGMLVEAELRVYPAIGETNLLDVIAHLPIERYLPGVLAAELYSDWPEEAFRTQAVAARSYALHERAFSRARSRNWDLERTTRSQAFLGETSLDVALEGAESTRGMVLTFDDELLRAYYSSSVGGRAASAVDVYRTDRGYGFNKAPPLQATPRQYFAQDSPTHRWSRTRSAADLTARLVAWGVARGHPARQLQAIHSIEITARNRVKRPTQYTITDAAGRSVQLTAEQLRVACNVAASGFPSPAFAERVLSSDLEFVFEGDGVEITGRGFGHGVGLCQYSAAELARRGETHEQILARYYPGAELTRWYE